MRTIGYILIITGVVFCLLETDYFGGNLYPHSKFEFVCDTVSSIMFYCGLIILYKTKHQTND